MFRLLFISFIILWGHINTFRIEPKVIAGTLSNSSDISYFVAISDNDGFLCGGSLLNDRLNMDKLHFISIVISFVECKQKLFSYFLTKVDCNSRTLFGTWFADFGAFR